MQVTRRSSVHGGVRAGFGAGFAIAPWIVAGALLLSVSAPATAQDDTQPTEEVATEGTLPAADAPAADAAATDVVVAEPAAADPAAAPADPAAAPAADTTMSTEAAATDDSGGGRGGREGRGGSDVAAVPAVGVGPGAVESGLNLFAIGAVVSAAAAGATALRTRLVSP